MAIGDFRRDPDVKHYWKTGGQPPEGHPGRCQAKNGRGGQCANWALRGTHYCLYHTNCINRVLFGKGIRRVSSWYRNKAGPTLQKKLHEIATDPAYNAERLELKGEIDLARIVTEEAMALFDKTHFGEKKASADVCVVAQNHLKDCLASVADLVKKQVELEGDSRNRLHTQYLGMFVAQLIQILHDEIGDDPRMEKVLERCQKIRLPENPEDAPRLELQLT